MLVTPVHLSMFTSQFERMVPRIMRDDQCTLVSECDKPFAAAQCPE